MLDGPPMTCSCSGIWTESIQDDQNRFKRPKTNNCVLFWFLRRLHFQRKLEPDEASGLPLQLSVICVKRKMDCRWMQVRNRSEFHWLLQIWRSRMKESCVWSSRPHREDLSPSKHHWRLKRWDQTLFESFFSDERVFVVAAAQVTLHYCSVTESKPDRWTHLKLPSSKQWGTSPGCLAAATPLNSWHWVWVSDSSWYSENSQESSFKPKTVHVQPEVSNHPHPRDLRC